MQRLSLLLIYILIPSFVLLTRGNTTGSKSDCYASKGDSVVLWVNSIELKGNKITKDHIITRELTFALGDSIRREQLPFLLESSRQNVLNTSLFNFVIIRTNEIQDSLVVIVEMIERWYIWPLPVFELADRNFNEWWEKKDFSRTNYGFYLKHDNFRGRKENLKLLFRFGYAERFGIDYKVPYINKAQKLGVKWKVFYTGIHQVNWSTDKNQQVFSDESIGYSREELTAGLDIYYRNLIRRTHEFSLEYKAIRIADEIAILNPDYLSSSCCELKYIKLNYRYKSDHRDIQAYPLQGYYAESQLTNHGLGIWDNDLSVIQALFKFSKYMKLAPRWYISGNAKVKLTAGSQEPYYIEQGLGYGNDFIRGYENYVVDGQNYYYYKSNLKFELVPKRKYKLPLIPTEKFGAIHLASYITLFMDGGYVTNRQAMDNLNNPLNNTFLMGYGVGIDVVTYYDKVMRIEYSTNKDMESGIYLHFRASI